MLAIPPFGASSSIALWRANIKPPLEVVVDNLVTMFLNNKGGTGRMLCRSSMKKYILFQACCPVTLYRILEKCVEILCLM